MGGAVAVAGRDVVAIVLGGGRGSRLYPLTKFRAKPAVPVAGKYRLVDIPISNCLHSGIDRIFVLTQFQSGSLNRHIFRTYRFESFGSGFIEVLAARQQEEASPSASLDPAAGAAGGGWSEGTADAVRRNLREFLQLPAREYLILAGDQLYRMDFRDLIRTLRETRADIAVAVTPVARAAAPAFGIMRVAASDDWAAGGRIVEFVEKPKDPAVLDALAVRDPADPARPHLASMGIYALRRERLEDLCAAFGATDFGRDVIPAAIRRPDSVRVVAHFFAGYWEDIGTIESFYKANLALADRTPPFDLYEPTWPIYTHPRYLPPVRIEGATVERSLVAEGCTLRQGCRVAGSIVGIRTVVGAGATVEAAVVLGSDEFATEEGRLGIGEKAVVRGAIVDKNVRIGRGARVVNAEGVRDRDGGDLYAIRDGIVVIPKGVVIPDGFVI